MVSYLSSLPTLLSTLIHLPLTTLKFLVTTFEYLYRLLYRNHNRHSLYQPVLTRTLFAFHLLCTAYLIATLLLPPLLDLLSIIGVDLGIVQIVPTIGEYHRLCGSFWGITRVVPGKYVLPNEWYLYLYWNPRGFALAFTVGLIELGFRVLNIVPLVAFWVVFGVVVVRPGYVRMETWLENRRRGSGESNMVINFVGLVGFMVFVYLKVYSYWYSE
jgi:hypothetical protein